MMKFEHGNMHESYETILVEDEPMLLEMSDNDRGAWLLCCGSGITG